DRHVAQVWVVDRVERLRHQVAVRIVDGRDQGLDARARCGNDIDAHSDRASWEGEMGRVDGELDSRRPIGLTDGSGKDRKGIGPAGHQRAGLELFRTELELPTPTWIGSKRVHGPSLAICPRKWLTEPVQNCRIRGESGTRIGVPV